MIIAATNELGKSKKTPKPVRVFPEHSVPETTIALYGEMVNISGECDYVTAHGMFRRCYILGLMLGIASGYTMAGLAHPVDDVLSLSLEVKKDQTELNLSYGQLVAELVAAAAAARYVLITKSRLY